MAENWPDFYRDICANVRDSSTSEWNGLYDDEDGASCLSFDQLFSFIGFLETHENKDVLITGVLLQGVSAFQLQEALRLQWSDLDVETGTAIIQGHHDNEGAMLDRPKNPYRIRKLTLPKLVMDYLAKLPRAGKTVIPYTKGYNAYGLLLSRALKAWNADAYVPPKDLRNTLSTHAQDQQHVENWNLKIIGRWMGHAPQGIREKHYYGDKKGRIAKLMASHITPKLDDICRQYGPNLHFFALDGAQPEPITTARILDIA
jgi:integrase